MWLIMTREQRSRFDDVGPIREALTPPLIVLRYWVELREVESDEAHPCPGRVPRGGGYRSYADGLSFGYHLVLRPMYLNSSSRASANWIAFQYSCLISG